VEITSILLAAGDGKRAGSNPPKQFISLNGKPVSRYSVDVLKEFGDVILVIPRGYKKYCQKHFPECELVYGGKTRSDSVKLGLKKVHTDYVLVHDAARPFITRGQVSQLLEKLESGYLMAGTATEVVDGGAIDGEYTEKGRLLQTQSPEVFQTHLLREAHNLREKSYEGDIHLVKDLFPGVSYPIIQGVQFNSKITYEKDLFVAEMMKKYCEPIETVPDLKNKKILVLGGSGEIGKQIVKILHKRGAIVWAPTRKQFNLVSGDFMSLGNDWDGVVHCAGVVDTSLENIFSINLRSALLSLTCIKSGNVVWLGSVAGCYGRKGISLYSASKAALHSVVESMSEELADRGVYLNCVAPAKVDTKMARTINPKVKKNEMISPKFVAEMVCRYLETKEFGHIVPIRKGFDDCRNS